MMKSSDLLSFEKTTTSSYVLPLKGEVLCSHTFGVPLSRGAGVQAGELLPNLEGRKGREGGYYNTTV